MTTIEITEEADKRLDKGELDEQTAMSLERSGWFDIEFPSIKNGHTYNLRSKGVVGHIPIGPDLTVVIRPKVPVATLFEMLEVAYSLKSFQLFIGRTIIESVVGLFERIAAILSNRILDRARKGLLQGYLDENDDLYFVRGRIDVRKTLWNVCRGSPKLHCEYQQLTYDLDDNQILLWTLYRISRAMLTRPEVVASVRKAYRVLAGSVQLSEKGPTDCIGRVYHRLNEDYRVLHGLCRLLLENMGPDIKVGDRIFQPFKLDMPALFEKFVAEWLKQNAPETWMVAAQHTAKLEANAELTFRIDLLLSLKRAGAPIAVLDTKYKAVTVPDENDVKRIVADAVRMGVRRAFLIYPSALAKPIKATVGQIEVRTMCFDLATPLNQSGNKFLDQLVTHL